MCSSLKFISEGSHLNLVFFVFRTYSYSVYYYLSLFRYSNNFSVLRLLTTEKFQNYETVKGGCIASKNKFKIQINIKLRWLPSDVNFKLLHTRYPIARDILFRKAC